MTQSNEPTIDSMNEAIAIFDGWEKKCKRNFKKDGYMFYIWEFKYHKSWDWLMPVCHKAREKAFELKGDERCQRLYSRLNAQLMFGAKEDVHLNLYQFITWYNQNQQATPNE